MSDSKIAHVLIGKPKDHKEGLNIGMTLGTYGLQYMNGMQSGITLLTTCWQMVNKMKRTRKAKITMVLSNF